MKGASEMLRSLDYCQSEPSGSWKHPCGVMRTVSTLYMIGEDHHKGNE